MEFITGFPRTSRQHESIMVVVNRLRKVAQIFIREILRLHGVPNNIISHRDSKFTSTFWKELFVGLGIELAFSTTYHPWTYGQIERVNRILEDKLRMYFMSQQRKWEEYLQLVDFSYNSGYQEYLKMNPFEALYGWSCNTLIR